MRFKGKSHLSDTEVQGEAVSADVELQQVIQKDPEKAMATHSSVLAWRIPGTAEPGGLPSMGSHGVGHDWSDLAAAAASRRI